MADRSVVVRLTAVVDQYKRAMAEAASSTQSVGKAAVGLKQLGPEVGQLGDSLTRRVTLPLLAAGVAAGKLSVDFDSTFRRMQGLAGVAAGEIDGLKDSVLDLAVEAGRAPQDVAEGLYFIRSAGLDGATALDALEISAKGATAGLGDTAVVADVLTSAINAYGAANLSAAAAGDVLAATAREGKAEAASLAPQFGRLLPVAAELGIEFHEVGAGLAFLSRNSGSAELSATQLSGIMQKLLKPTLQGAEALEKVGMGAEAIKRSIADRGLLATLEEMRRRLDANGVSLGTVFDDVQGLQGILAFTGDQAGQAAEVFDALASSTGAMGTAFDAAAAGPGFQMKQAFAELQAAAIELGDVLVPIAADIAGAVGDVAGVLSDLPGPAQTGVLALLGLVAVSGPILSMASRVGKLQTALEGLGGAGVTASKGLGAVARAGALLAGLAVAGVAVDALSEAIFPLERANLSELSNSLLDLAEAGKVTGEASRIFGDDLGSLGDSINVLVEPGNLQKVNHALGEITSLGGLIGSSSPELDQARQRISDLDAALTELAATSPEAAAASLKAIDEALDDFSLEQIVELLPEYRGHLASLDTEQRTAADGATDLGAGLDDAAAGAEAAALAVKDYQDALRASIDPLFAMSDATRSNAEAQIQLNELQAGGEASADELAAANQRVAETALGVELASLDLTAAVRDGSVSIDAAKAKLGEWVAKGLITEQQAYDQAAAFDAAALSAEGYSGDYWAHALLSGAAEVEQDLDYLTRARTVLIKAIQIFTGGPGKAAGGPVPAGWEGWVGERGPELVRFTQPAEMLDAQSSSRLSGSFAGVAAGPAGSFAGAGVDGGTMTVNNFYSAPIYPPVGVNLYELGRTVTDALRAFGNRSN